jgi:hypothetical protein
MTGGKGRCPVRSPISSFPSAISTVPRPFTSASASPSARNRHPWGTENRLIQFPRNFIELITAGEGADIPPPEPGPFRFAAFVAAYLARREGLAMFVLDSDDAKADAAAFAAAGIGEVEPFFFGAADARTDP